MKYQRWTEGEDEYLMSHNLEVTAKAMGKELGRTQYAVQARIRVLREEGEDIPDATAIVGQKPPPPPPSEQFREYPGVPVHIRLTS